ncbi:family 18 glycosyl hydrolase [Diaporthe sp. PMI_573]|nr:family 18 glycosyl hydrolase [Diaporthaceae sp. PMI_573]
MFQSYIPLAVSILLIHLARTQLAAAPTAYVATRQLSVETGIVLQIATPKLRVDNMENLGSRIAPWMSVAHNLGCQKDFGGCGDVKRPSCNGNSIAKRTIGYYESWSNTRKCQPVSPEDLNLNGFTHLNFAFASFDPSSFAIAPMDSKSGELFGRFTALKDTHPGLETWISVGGWSFTDPGPTRSAFSDMTGSSGNRQKFITGLISFMEQYGFDGVDLDWEYPQADDRGGITADKDNYSALVKDLRAAFGNRYGISMTLPTSFWYLQHFDLKAIQPNVDWFNFMSYDLHGTWDAQSKFLGPNIAPHTNVTEIDLGLDLLWRAGVKPEKVIMGFGWYGRSFTLTDPSCNTPNGVCQFSGGANEGPCSGASGILDLQEIKDVIAQKNVQPVWDKEAMVKWITWDSNQWISYDDDDTFDQKRKFANSRCLGGTMVWAIDQVNQADDNGLAPAPGVTTQDQEDAKQMSDDLAAGVTCYTTDCGKDCKSGTNEVSEMNGQPGKLSTNDRCGKGRYRSLCCDDGTRMGTCTWRGYRGVGLSCMGGCADGETEIVQDTNSHDKDGDRTCTGGIQSYCCKGFKPAPSADDLKDEAEDAAKDLAEQAAEQAALDIAAKAFCRIAVPALLAPLELIEAAIPIIGEILDIAEVAATPALIQLCVKGVEKEGKAVFKVFGKEHSLSMDRPKTTKVSRPPESSHVSAHSRSDMSITWPCADLQVDLSQDTFILPQEQQRADCENNDPQYHKTVTTEVIDQFHSPVQQIICDGGGANPGINDHPQACFNYASISRMNPQYATITCPYRKPTARTQRPVTAEFNAQRDRARFDGEQGQLANRPVGGCSPDEYPPAAMADINDGFSDLTSTEGVHRAVGWVNRGQLVRLIASRDNGLAGRIFDQCNPYAPYTLDNPHRNIPAGRNGRAGVVTYTSFRAVFDRERFQVVTRNMPNWPDDGMSDNACAIFNNGPVTHPGYAVLNRDAWFNNHPNEAALTAAYRPGALGRREWVDDIGLVVVAVNASHVASQGEIQDEFGFDDCADEKCARELRALRTIAQQRRAELSPSRPTRVDAAATPAVDVVDQGDDGTLEPATEIGPDSLRPDVPRYTGSVELNR